MFRVFLTLAATVSASVWSGTMTYRAFNQARTSELTPQMGFIVDDATYRAYFTLVDRCVYMSLV